MPSNEERAASVERRPMPAVRQAVERAIALNRGVERRIPSVGRTEVLDTAMAWGGTGDRPMRRVRRGTAIKADADSAARDRDDAVGEHPTG